MWLLRLKFALLIIVIQFGLWSCALLPECQNQAPSHTDELGETPTSLGGINLQCRYDTEHFSIYYNTKTLDSVEGVSGTDIELLENNLECVWDLYMEMAPEAYRFDDPRSLPFIAREVERIPVRVRQAKASSPLENNGENSPIMILTPFGGNFGCSGCPTPGYDTNAFHELGHVIFKSYNQFFNSGPVGFINEALPFSLVNIPLDKNYTDSAPILADGTNLEAFMDLSDQSIRIKESALGAPFWYFLAMTYTEITDPSSDYPTSSVPAQCRTYADAIRATPVLKMRRFPGRDVVLRIQQAFKDCHPAGLATPICRDDTSAAIVAVSCFTPEWPQGCVPEGFPDGLWNTQRDAVGEALMPWILDRIDLALAGQPGFVADDLPYKAFRDFLITNFLRGSHGNSTFIDTIAPASHPFRLKLFGAHYHVEHTNDRTAWRININKGADMPDWAYFIFYRDGTTALEQVPWSSTDSGEHVIIPHATASQIVTAVTSFVETNSDETHADTGAHYNLTMQPIRLTMLEPHAGARSMTSEPILIRWHAEGFTTPVHIYYSEDGGTNWAFVLFDVDNDGEFLWRLHHKGPGTYRFRIRSAAIPQVMAESEDLQFVRGSITVSSPSAGNELYRNEDTNIVWTSSNLDGNVSITLANPTETAHLARTTTNDGAYTARISLPAATYGYELNICSIEHPTICGSVAPLAVHDRGLILRYPLAENLLLIGEPYELRWENHGAGERVRIELSRDAGRTWSILDSIENTGLYRWTVTAPATTQGLFLVTSLTDPRFTDQNDGLFHIDNRTIEVVSPNGGESLVSGTWYTIRWTDNFDNPQSGSTVRIYHYHRTAWTFVDEVANTGSYPWWVPALPGGKNLIRVFHPRANVSDESDAPFIIE